MKNHYLGKKQFFNRLLWTDLVSAAWIKRLVIIPKKYS